MEKSIHLFLIILLTSGLVSLAQDNSHPAVNNAVPKGYYQTIDLNPDVPCNCNQKTGRTRELNVRLLENEVISYQLHTYKFSFGNNAVPASKLFKALENDPSVHKVSMKEWDSFMLLTTDQFDAASFEAAAAKAFLSFSAMQPEEFLKTKNMTSYNEYIRYLEMKRLKEESLKSQNETH